jgi:hypothetical protein
MIAWITYFFHWPPGELKKMTFTEFLWWWGRVEYIAEEINKQRGR